MDDDMNIDEVLKRLHWGEKGNDSSDNISSTRYQYMPTSVEEVMKNPEEFIIPECMECCKLLWSKGIDTRQCGNYDDALGNGFWIELEYDTLSDENKKKLEEMSKTDSRVYFAEGLHEEHTYRMMVERIDNPNASDELCEIASNLSLQDTCLFTTDEDLLDQYKRVGGEYKTDDYGNLYHDINPEREGATLYDALTAVSNPELYVAKEGRLYHSQHALNVHKNYLEQIDKVNSNGMHM